MNDNRLLHAEEPLTQCERAARFDHSTRIQIEHAVSRNAIRREWVRVSVAEDSGYGYAETRGISRDSEAKLDITVPGELDVVTLTNVILAEVQRQRAERTR